MSTFFTPLSRKRYVELKGKESNADDDARDDASATRMASRPSLPPIPSNSSMVALGGGFSNIKKIPKKVWADLRAAGLVAVPMTPVTAVSSSSSSSSASSSTSACVVKEPARAVIVNPNKNTTSARKFTLDQKVACLGNLKEFGGHMTQSQLQQHTNLALTSISNWVKAAREKRTVYKARQKPGHTYSHTAFLKWFKGVEEEASVARNKQRSIALSKVTGDEKMRVVSLVLQFRAIGYRVTRNLVVTITQIVTENRYTPTLQWAGAMMRDNGLTSRSVTSKVRVSPGLSSGESEAIELRFLQRLAYAINIHKLPLSMVVNFDQTSAAFHPNQFKNTYAPRDSKSVLTTKLDEKKSCTLLVGVAMDGSMLKGQLIFKGGKKCVPSKTYENLLYATSETGWSDDESMKAFITDSVIPYMDGARSCSAAGLPKFDGNSDEPRASCRGLLVFDCWSRHKKVEFRNFLREQGFAFIFVPAGATADLQPLDVAVNAPLKEKMASLRDAWVTEVITKEGGQKDDANMLAKVLDEVYKGTKDVRDTIARSASEALSSISTDIIKSAFTRAGWMRAIESDFVATTLSLKDKVTRDELGQLPGKSSSSDPVDSVKLPDGVSMPQLKELLAAASADEVF